MFKHSMIGRFALAVGFAALVLGCGGSSDTGNKNDNSATTPNGQQQQSDAVNLEQCADCTDFVVDSIVLPTDFDLVNELSRDIDGDDKPDNAIGTLVAQVLQIYNDFDVQQELEKFMSKGDVLAVVRLTADGGKLVDGKVFGQLWVAESEQCCTSDDPAQCASQANQSCFSGDYTFKPDLSIETKVAATGTFSGGKLRLEGQTVPFKVKIFGKPTTFEIRNTVIEGELSDGSIINGKLSGAIDKKEVSRTIVIQLVDWVNEQLSDDGLAPAIKTAILNVLDENTDGIVSITEITEGDLLGTIFSGDVDTDDDGVKEISVAFGYTAVPAKLSFGSQSESLK